MVLPQIPLPIIIGIPVLFIATILFTDSRYELTPGAYVGHGTTIASLAIGFVFLYALQKYDKMDANFPVVVRNIIFLADLALLHDPSLICFLIQYLDDFLNFDNSGYPIVLFEKELLELVDNENEIFRVRESVSILEEISFQRISGENLIPAAIWYSVFLTATLLTIIFPMDTNINQKIDAIILMLLIWVPILTIYILYLAAIEDLDNAIEKLGIDLEEIVEKEGVSCRKVFKETGFGDSRNMAGIDTVINSA